MGIDEIKVFCDDWNEFTPDERVRALLEDHCFCKDIKVITISETFAEYEVTIPKNQSTTTFFRNLKDIASEWRIGLITQEGKEDRVRLEIDFLCMTINAQSNK